MKLFKKEKNIVEKKYCGVFVKKKIDSHLSITQTILNQLFKRDLRDEVCQQIVRFFLHLSFHLVVLNILNS